jgi:hypothetical protein
MAFGGKDPRKHKRQTFGMDAVLRLNNDTLPEACLVIDISQGGAGLRVDRPDKLPEKFVLLLSDNGSVRRGCHIFGWSESEIGVRFIKIALPNNAAQAVQ